MKLLCTLSFFLVLAAMPLAAFAGGGDAPWRYEIKLVNQTSVPFEVAGVMYTTGKDESETASASAKVPANQTVTTGFDVAAGTEVSSMTLYGKVDWGLNGPDLMFLVGEKCRKVTFTLTNEHLEKLRKFRPMPISTQGCG